MPSAADGTHTQNRGDDGSRPRRVVLDLAMDEQGTTLHGTVQTEGASSVQEFWGVVDLVRILELVAWPNRQAGRRGT